MAEKQILVIIRSQPYTNLHYYEGLRTAIGLWEHTVDVLWTGNGVYALLKSADSQLTDQFWEALEDEDRRLLVDQETLEKHNISINDLKSGLMPVSTQEIADLMASMDTTLVF